jgi:hypothetical protein
VSQKIKKKSENAMKGKSFENRLICISFESCSLKSAWVTRYSNEMRQSQTEKRLAEAKVGEKQKRERSERKRARGMMRTTNLCSLSVSHPFFTSFLEEARARG